MDVIIKISSIIERNLNVCQDQRGKDAIEESFKEYKNREKRMNMNRYEEKKQARIERYRKHAANAEKESVSRSHSASEIAKVFEGGQPILVGHHSEARSRHDQAKIWTNMEKSVEAQKKAGYYESKAMAAENNMAISSDDSEAITKLRARLNKLTEEQKYKKCVNAYYRKHKTCRGCKGVSDKEAKVLDEGMKNTYSWVTAPFPGYELTSINEKIKRTQKRIDALEDRAENPPEGWVFDGGCVEINLEENRVQIFFDRIPSKEFRQFLHREVHFNWSKNNNAWQRQITDEAIKAACRAIEKFSKCQEVKEKRYGKC